MEEIYARFRDQVEFFVVYVQEAHPTDGWQTDTNLADGVLFRQHQSYEEREDVAAACSIDTHMTLPVLIEEMNNNIDDAYCAAPERLYIVDAQGKVAYHGGVGPHFFDQDEWEQALEACVRVTA